MIPLKISLDVEKFPLHSSEENGPMYPDKLHDLVRVGVLTEGTEQGNPVVIIRVNLSDKQFVLAQTTLKLFQMANIVFIAKYGDLIK